jgi:hypothetical protein
MKLSTRNVIRGKVLDVKEGMVMAQARQISDSQSIGMNYDSARIKYGPHGIAFLQF